MRKLRTYLTFVFLVVAFGIGGPAGLSTDTAQAKTRLSSKTPIFSRMVEHTTKDLTFYVSTTGNDSNDCLSAANACLTIQEAIDRIPLYVLHHVTINVGEGTFTGFTLANRTIGSTLPGGRAYIKVTGTMGPPTLSTGTAAGTATGGDTDTVQDSTQTWTVNELRGKFAVIDGETKIIQSNDATSFEIVDWFSAVTSGKGYEIVEPKTILDSNAGNAWNGYGAVEVLRCYGLYQAIYVENVHATSVLVGFYVYATESVTLTNITSDSQYGVFLESRAPHVNQAYMKNGTSRCYTIQWADFTTGSGTGANLTGLLGEACGQGVEILDVTGTVYFDGLSIFGATSNGLLADGASALRLTKLFIDGATKWGVNINGDNAEYPNPTQLTFFGSRTKVVSNCAGGGVYLGSNSSARFENLTGTGNTGYGMYLESAPVGARAVVDGSTSITGSLGDATIDDGQHVLTWSTDFAADGDSVYNAETGSRIKRVD